MQHALSTDEVGVERRAERIAPPGDARDTNASLAEQGVIDGDTERRRCRELIEHGATDDGKDGCSGQALPGEEAIISGPVAELLTAGGQKTSHGMTTKAEQTAQRKCLGAFGDTLLAEGGEALLPEVLEGGEAVFGVFFKTGGGGLSLRRARRLLSSMDHSTVSPRVKSMA